MAGGARFAGECVKQLRARRRGRMTGLLDYWRMGREQRLTRRNPLVRLFFWLCGPIGLHSRIRAGHVVKHALRLALPDAARVLDAGCGQDRKSVV